MRFKLWEQTMRFKIKNKVDKENNFYHIKRGQNLYKNSVFYRSFSK